MWFARLRSRPASSRRLRELVLPDFRGDGGPATRAQLRQPHSIAVDPSGKLLICAIGNHRIRQVDFSTGVIETYGGTGERQPTPDGVAVKTAPLNGPRTMAFDGDGNLYLALREGNAIYRIAKAGTIHHLAGTGEQGYAGDGGPARLAKLAGPKGLAHEGGRLYVADTESHVIRSIALDSGIITTVAEVTVSSPIRFDARCRGRTGSSPTATAFSMYRTARRTAYGS
jgi:DNA-binding beta-propeller fold protein YncE